MHMIDEFDLIRQFFSVPPQNNAVDLAVGDDAALFRVSPAHQCVVSSDMLVSGTHFFADVAPRALGHKALAVNLSDLAAMGAEPIGFTLSLALPEVDADWLGEFSAGLLGLAQQFKCDLIGGDTTRSPHLVINITVFGQLPQGSAVRRSAAHVGDDIWVSGCLGDAAYALHLLQRVDCSPIELECLHKIRHRLEQPQPRVALGLALRTHHLAHAMLDVSDGLAGDLMHILRASNVSAVLDCDALPLGEFLGALPQAQAWQYALTGGDDYELCFTAPFAHRAQILEIAATTHTQLTRVGQIEQGAAKINWRSELASDVLEHMTKWDGYQHFNH